MEELIDKLFEISKNNDLVEFQKNISDFYYFCTSLNKYWNLDDKTYIIIKFLLDKGNYFKELCNNEYILSNLFDYLRSYQRNKIFNIILSEDNLFDIQSIFTEYQRFVEISNLINNDIIIDNKIVEDSVNKFLNYDLLIYMCDALTLSLNYNFIEMSECEINKIMNLISDILDICLKENYSSLSKLNRDLYLKYIDRIIPIKYFVSNENISDDKLVKFILSNKHHDINLLSKLIEKLSPSRLLSLFDDDFNNILEFLLNIDFEKYDKYKLFILVFNKFLTENDFENLFEIYDSKYQDNYYINLIKEYADTQIINLSNKFGVTNEKSIKYLTENNLIYNDNIIDNIRELQEKNSILLYDDAYKEFYYYLKSGFDLGMFLSKSKLKLILRSIAKKVLEDNEIYGFKVLFVKSDQFNGLEDYSTKIIKINEILLSGFLNEKNELLLRIKLFDTLFHEIQHAIQKHNILHNQFDLKTYFMLKEMIIMGYDIQYYKVNYEGITFEIDARNSGFNNSIDFFKDFIILNEQLKMLKCEEMHSIKDYFDKKIFDFTITPEYFDKVFDKLVYYNPDLIEKYPVLKFEYNSDGTKHTSITYEDYSKGVYNDLIKSKQF